MMKKTYIKKHTGFNLLILLLLFINAASLYGEKESNSLSVENCIALALKQNSEIMIANEDKKIAKSKSINAWSSIFPKISLQSSYTGIHSEIQLQQMAPLADIFSSLVSSNSNQDFNNSILPEQFDAYTLKLTASQILFGAHVLPALNAAEYAFNLAEYSLLNQQNNIIFKTRQSYINILKAKKLFDLALENKKLTQNLIKQTEEMVSVGLSARSNLLRLKLQLHTISQFSLSSLHQLAMSQSQLNLIIGQPINFKFNTIDIKTKDIKAYRQLDPDYLLETAIKNRPEIHIIDYQIKLQETSIAVIESSNLPNIFFNGSLGMANDELNMNYNEHKDWNISIAGQWRFIDGGEVGSRVEEVRSLINKLKEQKLAVKRNIELEIKMILNEIELNIAKMETAKAEIALASENLSIAEEKISAGGITNLELIDSQTSLLKAKTNLITSNYDFEIIKAKLYKVININEKDILKIKKQSIAGTN